MTDVTQSSNPLITEPEFLDSEATKPISAADFLRNLQTPPRQIPPSSAAPKRRGRPPGSKNKPKIDPATGEVIIPSSISGGSTSSSGDQGDAKRRAEAERRLAQKKKRAKELESKILIDLNELILELLMDAGVPANALYVNPPEQLKEDSNYTALGGAIAFNRREAKVFSLTLSELEGSSIGGKASKVIQQDSPLRLLALGGLSLLMMGTHLKSIMEIQKQFAPFIEAQRRMKQQQRQEEEESNGI